jgi:hypothetical protein
MAHLQRRNRPVSGFRHEKGANSMAPFDNAHGLQLLDRLAQRRPTDGQLLREFPLRRQAISSLKAAARKHP